MSKCGAIDRRGGTRYGRASVSASVHVFTFKEGLLARIAHDLQIRATHWEIAMEGDAVRGWFALAGLRVDGAVSHGHVNDGALSASDRAKIERTMAHDVLATRQFPTAIFEGILDRDAMRVSGTLRLHGRTHALAPFELRDDGVNISVDVELTPSRWGIAPYRALAGALKLQDRVVVRITLPRGEGLASSPRWGAGERQSA
jgi:hypothetical protein